MKDSTTLILKETGIIFSTQLVPPVLDGTKTVTRRVIKPQLPELSDGYSWRMLGNELCAYKFHVEDLEVNAADEYQPFLKCPYGGVGDELYLKETWAIIEDMDSDKSLYYKADYNIKEQMELAPWRPSIHLPKKHTRKWMPIVSVRPERLWDITKEDAVREGVGYAKSSLTADDPKEAFAWLWDSINPKYPWSGNWWVWRIEWK